MGLRTKNLRLIFAANILVCGLVIAQSGPKAGGHKGTSKQTIPSDREEPGTAAAEPPFAITYGKVRNGKLVEPRTFKLSDYEEKHNKSLNKGARTRSVAEILSFVGKSFKCELGSDGDFEIKSKEIFKATPNRVDGESPPKYAPARNPDQATDRTSFTVYHSLKRDGGGVKIYKKPTLDYVVLGDPEHKLEITQQSDHSDAEDLNIFCRGVVKMYQESGTENDGKSFPVSKVTGGSTGHYTFQLGPVLDWPDNL